METPLSNISLTDEQCDSLLSELHAIGTDCDKYCYGLPIGNKEETDIMRNAIRNWLSSLQPAPTPVEPNFDNVLDEVSKEYIKSTRYKTYYTSFEDVKSYKNKKLILEIHKEALRRFANLTTTNKTNNQ